MLNTSALQRKTELNLNALGKKPDGLAFTLAKKIPSAISSGASSFLNTQALRRSQQTIGQQARTELIEQPAKILKTAAVDFPRMILGGFSSVGKSILETAYTSKFSPFKIAAEALGADTSKGNVRKQLNKNPELEKKLFAYEPKSWQTYKEDIDTFVGQQPESTDWEKKNLGLMIAVAGFTADAWMPGGKGKLTSKALKELIEAGTDDLARVTMIRYGLPEELAEKSAQNVARAKTAQEVETAIRGAAAQIVPTTRPPLKLSAFTDTPTTPKTAPERAFTAIDDISPELAQEARKYKSAEEFVDKQPRVFRGISADSTTGKFADVFEPSSKGVFRDIGFSITDDKKIARQFGDKVIEGTILPTAKIKEAGLITDESVIRQFKEQGFDGVRFTSYRGGDGKELTETLIFNPEVVKTKSQLTDIWKKAQGAKELPVLPKIRQMKTSAEIPSLEKEAKETLQLSDPKLTPGKAPSVPPGNKTLSPDIRVLDPLKETIPQAKKKATPLEAVYTKHGSSERIIEGLRKNDVLESEIENIVLEDGTKLVDTVKVKREKNGVLSAVITKKQLADIEKAYKENVPTEKWAKRSVVKDAMKFPSKLATIYEVPQVYFERKGLKESIYDPIRGAQREANSQMTGYMNRFLEAGLAKKGGWFTADQFTLNKTEAEKVGKYILTRQGKGYNVPFEALSPKEQKFVEIFDGIIKDTEPRFFEVAKKNGLEPGKVENYAPIMTSKDIELIDKGGDMDFITRKHPSFFSTKERVENVPVEIYETDYREVVARWLSGITKFNSLGDVAPEVKYLIDSDQFQKIVTKRDWAVTHDWFKSVMTPDLPKTEAVEAVNFVSRLLRKSAAIGSLGLNYASVVKQALTQVPVTIIEKAPPKFRSKFAKAFDIKVSDLPSIAERKGDISIVDLQGKLGRIFTGALTRFDQINAQKSLNALLDKEYNKFLKAGVEVGKDQQAYILKQAQDRLDLWYGGMTKEQLPPAFRQEIGRFLNMFILPLTSQLNGFFQHVLKAQGAGTKSKAIAEVLASVIIIAYVEQAITNLETEWSDTETMTKDVLQSMAGNIPIISQLVYALASDQPVQISAGVSGISNLLSRINDFSKGNATPEQLAFALAETAGLPKQIRRIREGMEIIEEGGIKDKEGKMLAPVKETDEQIRSLLRGKYGSTASKDWVRNIGEKSEDRRWFVPQVEFLQNGDYARKAELYKSFTPEEQIELRSYLSEGQQKRLDKALKGETSKETGIKSPFNIEDFGGRKKLDINLFK